MDAIIHMIENTLNSIEGTWHFKDHPANISDLQEFPLSYEKHLNKCSITPENLTDHHPPDVPYNASPFHLLLYYAPAPNFPFVLYNKDTVLFGSFTGRRRNNLFLSFPFFRSIDTARDRLNLFLSAPELAKLLGEMNVGQILIRDIGEEFANAITTKMTDKDVFSVRSLKEIHYNIYDIQKTIEHRGRSFENLRWHLNRFARDGHRVEAAPLGEARSEVIHLIGEWRRRALKDRNFSYVDVASDKFGANYPGDPQILSRVLRVDDKIAAFNLGYPIGFSREKKVFAHAIGICDLSIPGLAEFSQVDLWEKVASLGYQYINDGPSWRKGLEAYKKKFRPISSKRYYWATIELRV